MENELNTLKQLASDYENAIDQMMSVINKTGTNCKYYYDNRDGETFRLYLHQMAGQIKMLEIITKRHWSLDDNFRLTASMEEKERG